MRNLYSRLNITPNASTEEIQSALKACSNASIRTDASAVLLNKDRRQIYSQLNRELAHIGHLRAVLGLSHADNWGGEEAIEYTQKSRASQSNYQEFINKKKTAIRQAKKQEILAKFQKTYESGRKFFMGLLKLTAVFAVLLLIIVYLDKQPSSNRPSTSARQPASANQSFSKPSKSPTQAVPGKPKFAQPTLRLPQSGATRRHTSTNAVAPFEIKTSGDGHYLVKLQDNSTGKDVMDVFVRGGSTVEVKVPLGKYTVKYASGNTWYGYQYFFGPETGYNKADSIFHFRDDGYQYSGFTITLYQVSNGNLRTSRINPAQF